MGFLHVPTKSFTNVSQGNYRVAMYNPLIFGFHVTFRASQGQLHNAEEAPSIDKYASYDLQVPRFQGFQCVFFFGKISKACGMFGEWIRENLTSLQKVHSAKLT